MRCGKASCLPRPTGTSTSIQSLSSRVFRLPITVKRPYCTSFSSTDSTPSVEGAASSKTVKVNDHQTTGKTKVAVTQSATSHSTTSHPSASHISDGILRSKMQQQNSWRKIYTPIKFSIFMAVNDVPRKMKFFFRCTAPKKLSASLP